MPLNDLPTFYQQVFLLYIQRFKCTHEHLSFFMEDILQAVAEMETFCIPGECNRMKVYTPDGPILCGGHANPLEVCSFLFVSLQTFVQVLCS